MRVLVAEDSATARRVVEQAVSDLGHECVVAEDGLRAWELFEQGGADVVISDWMMPGIEGDELCRRVRSAAGPYAYFILLTSLEDTEYVTRGMEAGADDYLNKPLDRDALETRLIAASRVTGLHRRLEDQQRELERLNRELYAQARRDPLLTEIGNRLSMREELDRVESRVGRYGHTYAVALCDIDHFKAYNDTHGHAAGDEVLEAVADALVATSRREDAVYRYGGEEILVLLVEQGLDQALAAAERLRGAVEALEIPHAASETRMVTISLGVARGRGSEEGGADATLSAADAALYRAKEEGRNRAVAESTES